MLMKSTKFLTILLNTKQFTGKSPTKFSDIKTLLKLLPGNSPAGRISPQQTNSEEVLKIVKNIRNDYSNGFGDTQISLIKHVAEYIVSPLVHKINTQISKQTFTTNCFPHQK